MNAKLKAENNSTMKYLKFILAKQSLHFALRKIKDNKGTLSYHLIFFFTLRAVRTASDNTYIVRDSMNTYVTKTPPYTSKDKCYNIKHNL